MAAKDSSAYNKVRTTKEDYIKREDNGALLGIIYKKLLLSNLFVLEPRPHRVLYEKKTKRTVGLANLALCFLVLFLLLLQLAGRDGLCNFLRNHRNNENIDQSRFITQATVAMTIVLLAHVVHTSVSSGRQRRPDRSRLDNLMTSPQIPTGNVTGGIRAL